MASEIAERPGGLSLFVPTWATTSPTASEGRATSSAHKKRMMLSLRSPTITSQSSRCGHNRGRSRSRKITYNTITKKQEQQMIGESITFRISDEDGNIVEIEAERTISMQEVFDCELRLYLFVISHTSSPTILSLYSSELIHLPTQPSLC